MDEDLRVAEAYLETVRNTALEMGPFLREIGNKLESALRKALADPPESGFGDWLHDKWLEAASSLMWAFRTRVSQEVVGLSQLGDWLSAEKVLAFLIADIVFPRANPGFPDRKCPLAALPMDVRDTLFVYLRKLTIHEFTCIRAYFASLDDVEHRADELHNFFSSVDWLDRAILSWTTTRCPYESGCPFAAAPGHLGASQLGALALTHRQWKSGASSGPNPIDELRPSPKTLGMLDLMTRCRVVRDTLARP